MATVDRLEYVLAGRDELTRPLKQAEGQMKSLGRQAERTNKQMGLFSSNLANMGKGGKAFAMGGLQQAGYQIGDYAVQVANGTSKMQAFGQQAPQFLQIFGPIGSVVGAAVAVFAAFGVAAQKTAQASADATPKIMAYKDALKNLSDQATATKTNLMLMVSGLASMEELAIQKQIVEARNQLVKAEKALANARGPAKVGAETRVEQAREAVRLAEQALTAEILRVDMARNIEKFANTRTQAGQKMVEQANAEVIVMSQSIGMHETTIALKEQAEARQAAINSALEAQNKFANSRTEAAIKLNEHLNAEEIVMGQIVGKAKDVLELEEKRLKVRALIEGLRPEKQYGGRGGDPRSMGSDYMNQLGYKSVEELIAEMEGKKTKREVGDPLKDLRERVLLNQRLMHVSEARKEVMEAIFQSERQYTPQQIEDAVKLVSAYDKQVKEMERIKSTADMIGAAFENAFMSMIDGTKSAKDAFKDLTRSIIADLYRQYVVKQITGFITQSVGAMMAGPVQGPNLPSANGGGYTGNGARAGGLDGRGGFMAMLHPRETIVDHTKGQSAGGVIVNQTINVSTGVQQTVRTEIKSLMPQIAESAKSAVMDAKRRGGSYGRSFA